MAQPGQPSTTTTRAPQRRPFVYWPSQSPHASIGSASHSGFASAVSDSSRISQSRQGRIEHLHNADRRQSLCKLHQIPTVTGSAKSLLPSALRYAKLYHWRVTKNDRHTEKRCHPATTALTQDGFARACTRGKFLYVPPAAHFIAALGRPKPSCRGPEPPGSLT